jgi:hypothetical protein
VLPRAHRNSLFLVHFETFGPNRTFHRSFYLVIFSLLLFRYKCNTLPTDYSLAKIIAWQRTYTVSDKTVPILTFILTVQFVLMIGETIYDAARSVIPSVLLSSSRPVLWPVLAWCGCRLLSRRIWMPSRKNLEQVSGHPF